VAINENIFSLCALIYYGWGKLISLSRFVLAALIDFSIIATSAVSWIPLKVMETEFRRMEWKIHCFDTVTVKKFGSQDQLDIARDDNRNELTLEQIMPAWDSISWPLVFLGCGILNLSDSTRLPEWTVSTDLLLQQWLKLLISLMIVLPMIILMVTNMMRIFFIWLWAMFAPIIALDIVWGWPLTKDWSSVQKYFSPKNILWLIFQPVAVVACMSIGIILILWIYDAQIWWDRYQQESMEKTFSVFPLWNDKIQVGTWALNGAYINGTVLEKSGNWIWWAVGELIMVLFCIVVLWTLIKVGFSASEITKWVSDWIYKFGTQMAKSVPIVPTSFGWMSIGALEKWADQMKQNISNTFRWKQSVQADKLSKLMWMSEGDELTSSEMWDIITESTKDNKQLMLNKISSIQENKPITVNSELKSALQNWLTHWWQNSGLQHIRSTWWSRFASLTPGDPLFNEDNIGNVWTWSEAKYKLVRQYFDTFLKNWQVNDWVDLWSDGQLQSRYNRR